MKQPEYERLKRRIKAEYDEKIRALDLVFSISAPTASNSAQSGRKTKGAVPQAVRFAMLKMTGEFSARDIEEQIKKDNPSSAFKRASISGTLKRMIDSEVMVTLEGKGKRPSKYRRKQ